MSANDQPPEPDEQPKSGDSLLPSAKADLPVQGEEAESESLNTDDRAAGVWQSRYPEEARRQIRVDAAFVTIVFIGTTVALILTWRGTLFNWAAYDCNSCSRSTFDQYAYFFLGGLFGGTLYGVKYLYKVVARARWNADRRLWRLFSPFLSGGLAVAVCALVDSGILGLTTKSATPSSFFSLGFITGYFADKALAKMQEIAETIFGPSDQHHTSGERKKNETKKL